MMSFPIRTELYKIEVNGEQLLKIFEISIKDHISKQVTRHGGGFLQVSGIKV